MVLISPNGKNTGIPYAYLLVLIGQMLSISIIEIVRSYCASVAAKKVLRTAIRSQVTWIAIELSDLKDAKIPNKFERHLWCSYWLFNNTLMLQDLIAAAPTPTASFPNWNAKSLQAAAESMYTKNKIQVRRQDGSYYLEHSLCSPVFVPQITGLLFCELVTENVSVRHWVAKVAAPPPASLGAPLSILVTEVVSVLGPVMTKVSKSKRSYGWNVNPLQYQ